MRLLVLFILFPLLISIQGKSQSYRDSILLHRQQINEEFANPETSILDRNDLEAFSGLPFFSVDDRFRIKAKIALLPPADPFRMRTSDRRIRAYERYALATFELDGRSYTLTLYQSLSNKFETEEEESLFLPFTDETCGKEPYGGGKYLDLPVPNGDSLTIDFNLAYNPYCAYSDGYSCPIPPKENHLPVPIIAGVMYTK